MQKQYYVKENERVSNDRKQMKKTGAWAKSGNGFCLKCATDLCPEDFDSWDYEGDIVCDNCGKDTRED